MSVTARITSSRKTEVQVVRAGTQQVIIEQKDERAVSPTGFGVPLTWDPVSQPSVWPSAKHLVSLNFLICTKAAKGYCEKPLT